MFKPSLYIKTGAGFGRQFIVTDDSHIGKTTMEILHVLLKRLFLPGGTGVRRRFTILCTPAGIDDMAAPRNCNRPRRWSLPTGPHSRPRYCSPGVPLRRSDGTGRYIRPCFPAAARPFETGFVCQARISAPLTSRPSGVAVQWMTRYFSFPITHRLPLHQRPPGTVLSPPSSPDRRPGPVQVCRIPPCRYCSHRR